MRLRSCCPMIPLTENVVLRIGKGEAAFSLRRREQVGRGRGRGAGGGREGE